LNYTKHLIKQNEALRNSWDRLQHNITRNWDLYGYDTGIHSLNMAIGGFIPTKVTVIGGRSGSGKTAILVPMFEASIRRKSDESRAEYLFFTWETDPSIIIDRVICERAGLTTRQLNQGAKLLSEKTMAAIKSAYELASKFPITYQPYSIDIHEVIATANDFVKKCEEKSQIEGCKIQPIIVIDYLNMAQFENAGLRTYGISEFMNGIKRFCNQTKAAAVILTQINRDTDKTNKIPDRADFSDSSSIENAADNLIALYRPEYHQVKTILNPETGMEVDSDGKLLIRVLKGRDYGTGDFLVNCDIKHYRFWDIHQEYHDFEYWKSYSDPNFWRNEFNVQAA
jgi:replicative DNA helicase